MNKFLLIIPILILSAGCFHHKHKKDKFVISQEIENPSPINLDPEKGEYRQVPFPSEEGKKNPENSWWSWE